MPVQTMENLISLTDLRDTLATAGKLAAQAAASSADCRQDLGVIAAWWGTVHAKPEHLLAVLYLRLQEESRSNPISSVDDVVARAREVSVALRSYRNSTVNELLRELDSDIANSGFLSRRIVAAREELAAMAPDLDAIARDLMPRLKGVIATTERSTLDPADDSLRCWLGTTRASCWLVLTLIVISIIVL